MSEIFQKLQDSQVTVIISPRDRYTGVVECIHTLYQNTTEPFRLMVLDLGYPIKLLRQMQDAVRKRPGAQIISLGRIIPMEAFKKVLPDVHTPYTVLLDNDSRVTQGWLSPLLSCAQSGAQVITPLTLEREGLDGGGEVRNHIYVSELRKVDVAGRTYLIEYKPYRREDPDKVPKVRAPTDLFELHCVFIETEWLRKIELRPMVIREHIDMAMQFRKLGARLVAEPRSVVIFDNLNQRMDLEDMLYFFFRWSDELADRSARLFEAAWGYKFYTESSMKNWMFRRKVYLLARYLHLPNAVCNRLSNGLNRLMRPQWDPLKDPIAASQPFFPPAEPVADARPEMRPEMATKAVEQQIQ